MTPISTLIREQSRDVHEEAESSSLMTAIASGDVEVGDYAALVGQLRWVYQALDAGAELRRAMPEFSTVFDVRLDRRAAIAKDLLALGVQEDLPTAATRAYANRIAEMAQSWPLGLLAHHYTRYMGDLSGGRIIGSALRTNLGLTADHGLAFYEFDIPSIPAFKKSYRSAMDALPLTPQQKDAFVQEVMRAFSFNTAMFESIELRPAR